MVFIFGFGKLFSQTSKNIQGFIKADFELPEGIHVSNITRGYYSVSDKNGRFFINASINDTIKLTAINAMVCQLIINKNDFELGQIFPELKENVVRLDEVTLTGYQKMDLVKMGIIPKEIIERTPAEKRLYFATSARIDFIWSLISGDYKRIRKEMKYEKINFLIDKINARFEDSFFINELKIPPLYVKGFKAYCVDDAILVQAFETESTQTLKFLLMEKSYKYLEFIKNH